MTIENDQQAAEALFAAVEADRAAESVAPNVNTPPEQVETPAPQGTDEPEGTTEGAPEDSFTTRFDPNKLPEELVPAYRSMQADYTRTKQRLAEQEKAYDFLEPYGGPEAAKQAVDFVVALATDPEYQLQVHEQLTSQLQAEGLTPRQASQEASRQINEAITEQPDEFDDLGLTDPAIERKLTELERSLAEERAWREQREEFEFQQGLKAELDRQEATILRDNPEFGDDEIQAIYSLAYSTGGDLEAAADAFKGLRDNILASYIQTKSSVPAGVTPLPNANAQPEGRKFTDINDPELEKLVQQRLAAELAANA